jgi:hypothetical protein
MGGVRPLSYDVPRPQPSEPDMEELEFSVASTRQARRGDFGMGLSGMKLMVPADMMSALARKGLKTPEVFVSYLLTFPTDLAQELGWTRSELEQASSKVVQLLRDYLPREALEPPRFGSGARDPRSYGK